jgi:serine/threonine-protein kinase
MAERSERDEITRDLRGSGSDPAGLGAAATATAAPTPVSSPIAETIDDTSSGVGALAATLAAPSDAPDLVGKSLDRYRVQARLGAGGMGVVYAALDPALDRKVALKVLPPMAQGREAHLEARLRREAQALARLDHPNVVRVYDVGVAEHSVFVAMQLVEGTTLADWLEEAKPPAKDVLAAFVAAARGLAAAHAAGIVHRDVKPSNILVDRQGRVYVGDFGLARGASEAPDEGAVTTTSENLLDEQMTREGSVLGTPLYMSPEQHQGLPATPRSDQFSFCVSLWQALFDEHPFVGGRWAMAQAIDAMARDAIREPPSRGVPARVVRALRRGMRHDPEARWPSMDALIDELAPRARAPWLAIGLTAAGLASGVGVAIALGGGAPSDPCANAGAALATTWGASTAKLLRDGFAATGLPYAEHLAGQVTTKLDKYGADWQAMRIDACRANRRGEQSDALLDRRMRCLDRRLAELGAQVQILTHAPSRDVVDTAPALVGELPSLDECTDIAALSALVEGPQTPTRRPALFRLDDEIARARAAIDAGTAADPVALADGLLAQARQLDDGAVLARALDIAADARSRAGDLDGALPLLREAVVAGERGHDDLSAVRAVHDIANLLDSAGKPEQALVALDESNLYAARTRVPPSLQADLLVVRASALVTLNRFAESDAAYKTAVEIEEQAHGKDSWQFAEGLVDRSKLLNEVGRYDEAVTALGRAIPILERELGAEHPHVAIAHQNLGNAYLYQGKHDLARAELERALAIKRVRYPAGAPTIAFSLQSLAIIDLDSGDLVAAQRGFQEAYDLRKRLLGEEHPDTLSSLYELGVVARMQGRHDDARAILERVLTGRIHHFGEMHTSIANVLDALANVDQATGKYDAAIDERKRSLAIREKVLGPEAGDVSISLLGLAEIELELGRCPDARAHGERALAILEKNHAEWWDELEPLGVAALCEDRPAELATLRARLEPMLDKALAGTDVDRKGDAQFALGVVLYEQGERARGRAMVAAGAAAYRDGGQPDGAKPMQAWLATHR